MPKKKKEEEAVTFLKSLKEELPKQLKGGLRKVVKKEVILSPQVNIYQDGDDFLLLFNMPGKKNDDVIVKVIEDELCVEEVKKEKKKIPKKDIIYEEKEEGRYFRKFKLTPDIDQNSIKATLEDGVLKVKLPKK